MEKSKLTETEKGERAEEQNQNNAHHFPVTFYGDCVKMCEEFAPDFGGKRTGCCVTATLRLTLPF
jgi:hypothetical protein